MNSFVGGITSFYNTFRNSLAAAAEDSAAGCVEEEIQICESGSNVPYPPNPNINWNSFPGSVRPENFEDGPMRICWEAQSDNPPPIANCDGTSLEGIALYCDLGTGRGVEEFTYDENGHLEVCGLFRERPGQILCDYTFTDLRTGEILSSRERTLTPVTLWPPIEDTSYQPTDCDNPFPRTGNHFVECNPPQPREGEMLSCTYPAQDVTNCEGTTEGLDFSFIIGGERTRPIRSGNNFVATACLEYPTEGIHGYDAIFEVLDNRQDLVSTERSEIWMAPAIEERDMRVYVSYGRDGAIVGRPVNLSLNFLTVPPGTDYEINWEIYRGDGLTMLPEEQALPGRNTQFTPLAQGFYSFRATVTFPADTGCRELEPLVVEGYLDQPILPFSAPNIEIDGNRYPTAGGSASYRVVAMRTDWRELGTEDAAATYTVRVFREGEAASYFEIDEPRALAETFAIPWPMVATAEGSRLYIMEVVVDSDSYSDPVVVQIPITLYAAATTETEAAMLFIVTDYPERITHRPIAFRASEIAGVATYEWRISEANGVRVDIPIGDEIEVEHLFNTPGTYSIELTLLNESGAIINTTTQPITIYAFPAPAVDLVFTDPIFANEPTDFILTMARAGGAWPEDEDATITWRISHDEAGGREVDDSSLCVASGRDLSCSFPAARTYKIEYNVQGVDSAYSVNRVELVTVYSAGAVEADIFVVTPFGDRTTYQPIEFRAAEMAGAASYTWRAIEQDGRSVNIPLGSGQDISHTFTEDATYTIELVVRNAAGEEISTTTDTIVVYPFPQPTVALSAASEPLFAGEESTFILSVARGGGLLDVDRDARLTWRVFHNEAGGREVSDMALCSPSDREITCNFTANRTYGVGYTLASPGGEYEVSGVEFFNVYTSPAVRPPRVNVSVAPATYGPYTGAFAFDASRSTVAEGLSISRFTFNFADGSAPANPPDGRTPHTFPRAGVYNVVVTVEDSEGRTSEAILEIHPY